MGALYRIPTAAALVQTSAVPHVCHQHELEEGAVGMQGEDLGCALEAEQQDSLWKWVRQDGERGGIKTSHLPRDPSSPTP